MFAKNVEEFTNKCKTSEENRLCVLSGIILFLCELVEALVCKQGPNFNLRSKISPFFIQSKCKGKGKSESC